MPRRQYSEAELAQSVVEFFEERGYDVYQEVSTGSRRADIVAKHGSVLTIIEVKRSLSLSLLDQCATWITTNAAHRVIAAHGSRRTSISAERLCRLDGIGLMSVRSDTKKPRITEALSPRLTRRVSPRLSIGNHLREEQRDGTYAKAGAQGGGYWTPFQHTARAITEVVKKRPGITLKELMDHVDHHYASDGSARGALPDLIRKGAIPGVCLEEGRPIKLHPA